MLKILLKKMYFKQSFWNEYEKNGDDNIVNMFVYRNLKMLKIMILI